MRTDQIDRALTILTLYRPSPLGTTVVPACIEHKLQQAVTSGSIPIGLSCFWCQFRNCTTQLIIPENQPGQSIGQQLLSCSPTCSPQRSQKQIPASALAADMLGPVPVHIVAQQTWPHAVLVVSLSQ